MFTLGRLLDATGGRVVRGPADPELEFTGGAFDSRTCEPGSCFFALRDQRDGHDFVAHALSRGARGAVVERVPEDVPAAALLVQVTDVLHALRRVAEAVRDAAPIPAVGITGNVGKTTAKQATAATLGTRYRVLSPAASFNNEIGVPLTFLAQEPSHEVAVIEMGFYVPGEIADLARLVRPRVGAITRIPDRPVHYSRTPSVDAIARGKAELIEALPEDGLALLNADDPRVRALARLTRARVVLYGEGADAELRASDVDDRGLAGVSFTVSFDGETARAELPLPGRHMITAALVALGAAAALDVPLDEAAVGLATLEPPAHRMAVRRSGAITLIDDSYNASPAAVHAALEVLRGAPGRHVAVLGDMRELGDLSADAHEDVGRDAARSAQVIVGVGELARTIVDAAKRAGHASAHAAADGAEALILLRRLLRDGDTVLVKGSRALALDELADALVAAGAS
ncbi:MAG TPA: UDP-N-acetylmuramoyl-tripeptide--D-alanyl-D-alanine ligase [Candidatus Limnocylindria bacterium]|nr:UDP-N-acetylmuramoyl-tripeptide--D-alanyl-D-alanine ligase [Candidatus Limnocylindria bacterium]